MCVINDRAAANAISPVGEKGPTTSCFTCSRLNASTFLIVEEDKYRECPFIYVKVFASVLVLIDTGCGGAAQDPSVELTSLRRYLEKFPLPENGDQPLNPQSQKGYAVICTHCHFDHIGAISQFTDTDKSEIWASSYDKSFLDKETLPTNSICELVEMDTPDYTVTNWADDGQRLTYRGDDLGLICYHTPGHTPDSIAIWDPTERVLFVGDTLYEWISIIFPLEGNVILYSETLEKLKALVSGWDASTDYSEESQIKITVSKVKIASGHVTSASDAAQLLSDVDSFLYRVLAGKMEGIDQGESRGEQVIVYKQEGGRVKFYGPKKLFDQARNDKATMQRIIERHN